MTRLETHPALPRRVVCQLMRRLTTACGGVVESGGVLDLSKSRIGQFQDPNGTASPTVAQVLALEIYCGEPIFTRAIAKAQGFAPMDDAGAPDLTTQAIDLTTLTSNLAATAARAMADNHLCENEADLLRKARHEIDLALEKIDARTTSVLQLSKRPAAQ